MKACEIIGKFIKKEKDLFDDILGSTYKRLNRYFEVANIEYAERPPPTYIRGTKSSIEATTHKKGGWCEDC